MIFRLIFLSSFFYVAVCSAQGVKHKTDPALKAMMDTAANRYARAGGGPDNAKKALGVIETFLKKDSLYFEAWSNKLNLQCQLNEMEAALKTVRSMKRIFPNEADALFLGGVLEYHSGHKNEATADFNKLLILNNAILKGHENDPKYKGVLINKGIVLILLDRPAEGKALLQKIYDREKDQYLQSYIGFYIMSSKEEIIADRIPGK